MVFVKIITEGNTQKVIPPKGVCLFDFDEAKLDKIGDKIILIPKTKDNESSFYEIDSEEYEMASDEEVFKISDKLIKQNLEAYKELAKY